MHRKSRKRWSSTRLGRHAVVLAATTLVAAVAVASSAQAASSAPARAEKSPCKGKVATVAATNYGNSIDDLPLFTGIAEGFFAKNCLRVKPVTVTSANAALALAVNGSINFVLGSPESTIDASAGGLAVRIVGNIRSRLPAAMVVSTKSGLQQNASNFVAVMQGLEGKKIGINAPGTVMETAAQAAFTAAGIDPATATYVPLGSLQAMIAALANGTVDAAELYGAGPEIAVAEGFGFIANDLRVPGSPMANGLKPLLGSTIVWMAVDSYVQSHAKVVAAYKRASDAALTWMEQKKNLPTLVKIAEKYTPLPPNTPNAAKVMHNLVAVVQGTVSPTLVRSALVSWEQVSLQRGEIKNLLPLSQFVWSGAYK